MLNRPHYIALALVAAFTLLFLNLPAHTSAQVKMMVGNLFLPLFGLSGTARELGSTGVEALTPRAELIRQRDSLLKENQRLELLTQRLESLEQENNRLRVLVGWERQQRASLKLARVVGRDPSNWWRTVQIDVGSRHGVRENMPVLTMEGLVGRVSAVSHSHSQVVLLGDPQCKVAARVENDARDAGIIGPAGPLDRELVELSYITRSAILQPGQKVRTSGDGTIFPRDIPIGTIVDSHAVEYGLYTVARVKLAANLAALDELWVMIDPGTGAARQTSTRKQ